MIKLLGMGDIIAAILLFMIAFNINPIERVIIFFAAYLIIKGVIFFTSIASGIDLISGILILSSLYLKVPSIILMIIATLLLQKGIFSLFS
jgi:hypothetical protein